MNLRTITVDIDDIARALNALDFRAGHFRREGVEGIAVMDKAAHDALTTAWNRGADTRLPMLLQHQAG